MGALAIAVCLIAEGHSGHIDSEAVVQHVAVAFLMGLLCCVKDCHIESSHVVDVCAA
jgi:hypothetical protein